MRLFCCFATDNIYFALLKFWCLFFFFNDHIDFERETSNRHVNSQTNISSSHTTLLGVPCSSSNVINDSNLTDSKFLPRVIKASLSAPLPSSNRDQSTTISATAFASSQNLPLISSKFGNYYYHLKKKKLTFK